MSVASCGWSEAKWPRPKRWLVLLGLLDASGRNGGERSPALAAPVAEATDAAVPKMVFVAMVLASGAAGLAPGGRAAMRG